ncbi:SPOR domain-containing protein [Bosea sp. (in: a-proteobacteria)]|uniref:SPOR domain-containing protein n=1 Tax=Bosea sp. (in: a-proteobacteria) TaxID=1871050 RepID=UPI001AC49053|nr:SPOR domain-containing protein [Bosea sp. (in: a-proteobacteria)]MBN9438576.1 SPOR domain-containing protein [Bosea sp. (in: a-proteobacteria)]
MSEPARNRFALDLDDLERQLRGAAQPQKPGSANDPLMELTRLVGQDDPLKELFSGRPAAPVAVPVAAPAAAPVRPVAEAPAHWPATARVEPSFHPAPASQAPAEAAQPPAELMGALDEFEALLRRTEPGRAPAAPMVPVQAQFHEQARRQETAYPEAGYAEYDQPAASQHGYAAPAYVPQVEAGAHAYVPEEPRDLDEAVQQGYPVGYDRALPEDYAQPQQAEEDARQYAQPRSRKGLWAAAAVIAVTVAGVGLAMTFRGSRPTVGADGQPPVISADAAPTKVAPVNPGGAEIPNQNKQIYERSGETPAAETKVVSREEQPVDVQQAARSMPSRPGSSDTTSAALASGEPGLIAVPPVPGLGEPRKVRTVAIRPDGTPVPPAGNGAVAPAPQPMVTGSAPVGRAAATPTVDAAKVQDRAAAPTTSPAAVTPPPRTRTAALDPVAPTSAAPAAPRADANGGFAVQLAAPGSEAEARATFAALQRKYPTQLSGQSPIVRKTELAGGKTVYRLRVGPYSREDAATMCTALQAAGGQCFIAKN